MKKILTLAAIAAMSLSLTSCEALLDVISKHATFQFSADPAYDGQEMVVKRTGTCNYLWAVTENAKCVTNPDGAVKIYTGEASKAINGQDSTAVITFTMKYSSNNSETVKVKAMNRLYPDNETYMYETEVKVHKWALRIKDCVTGQDLASGAYFETDVPYMAYLTDLETGKPIDKITYNLAVGKNNRTEEVVDFTWNATPTIEKLAVDGDYPYNPNVALAFKIKTVNRALYSLTATLHNVTSSTDLKFTL